MLNELKLNLKQKKKASDVMIIYKKNRIRVNFLYKSKTCLVTFFIYKFK